MWTSAVNVSCQLLPVLTASSVALVDFLEAHEIFELQEAHREVEQPWNGRGKVLLPTRPVWLWLRPRLNWKLIAIDSHVPHHVGRGDHC